jgi:anaerobic ribonucleoside-triphosphate reductase activating protein
MRTAPDKTVNMTAFLPRSRANGPGERAVVWVQGCPIRCKWCGNPEFLDFAPRRLIPARGLARRILAVGGIDGVTFSGGEPFAQAAALAEVGERIRDAGLTVVTYTGYTHEHLHSGGPDWAALLRGTDLLIDGPYVEALAGDFLWRGSSNQRLVYLTPPERWPTFRHEAWDVPRFELHVAGDEVHVTGFPTDGEVERLSAFLAAEGEEPWTK